ncbi:Transcription initiation factor TFIID, subunit TAF12 [Handroanthus impetiginosus]|uniref:Transcription initiation factor TFIID, subunit TAF12 n=1 Tax=Handroanthus impetiginosus TaxID=429701 RepID=A0A2G9GJD1_9LAMI|nr:Transcription initiation factor TFIID, subunit TAF12 [Handroanthus impetiginosus]
MEQTPSVPQSSEQQQPPQNPQPPSATTSAGVSTASSSLPPPTTTSSFPNPNSTPTSKPPNTLQSQQSTTSQTRPSFNTRPWQQPPYSHFSLPSPPLPASSASTSTSISAPPASRGGMAIGVPAHNPSSPAPPPTSFSSLTPPSYGQQSQIRPPMQGMGMTGTLGATSTMRPAGVPSHQLRPSQSSLRPQTSSSSQSPAAQNFQGHGMLRVSSLGSPGSPSPGSSQSPQPQNQPWLSSGTQGKPPLPAATLRPQTSSQSFQQRSHIPQQHHHNAPHSTQQQPIGSSQQSPQSSALGQQQEHYGQQFPASRIQQSLSHQQQITRGPGLGSQRPSLGTVQSGALPSGAPSRTATVETEESCNRIVSKRSIQELVNQIDPSEKLDPDVEDILVDIAEDFVESITTFGCSLAKHRKSTTLESKDILLHLERNWNMSLPGFGGDEIRTYRKPTVTEIHRERLAAVKKSIAATDTTGKNSTAPSGAKGHVAKGPASIIGSPPNPKIREAA